MNEKQIFQALRDIKAQLGVIADEMVENVPEKVTCEMEFEQRVVFVNVLNAQTDLAYAIEKLRKIVNK